jgi:PBP1b-binding outer membrane lipoprotein LpoB
MKKLLSLLAIALMIVGLSGCMDNPDGSKQKVTGSSSISSVQL